MDELAGAKGNEETNEESDAGNCHAAAFGECSGSGGICFLARGIQLAQAGAPGGDQFSQQVCNLAHQNAQSYARILQLRDKMLKIQRDNEARFQALEKGRGGGQNRVSVGSTAILDDAMRDNGSGGGQGGGYQSPGLQQELVRNLTGKVEDVDAQISFTDNQLQKTQEDNEFRFEELEKKNGVTSPASSGASQPAPAAASPGLISVRRAWATRRDCGCIECTC